MESIKTFFAKDSVKIVMAGMYFIVNGLIVSIMPESPTKQMVLSLWLGIVTPGLVSLGIISGGTSGLRSNASVAQAATLKSEGVLK